MMMDTVRAPSHDRAAFLRRHRIFCELPPKALDSLANQTTRKVVKKHTVLFAKGDAGDALIGVLKGAVKISVAGHDGQELSFTIAKEGDIFGEIALLDGGPRSADATAMSDCELLIIGRTEFLATLRREPHIAMKIVEILCERVRQISEHVEDFIFLNSHARLAKAVLSLSEGGSAERPETRARITQQEIGQIIGLSREMTNRQLREWQRSNLIRLERGSVVVLNPGMLARIAGL